MANHPEVLWYPRLQDISSERADWSMNLEYYTGSNWPKVSFMDVPEFGMTAARFESRSLKPDTRAANGDGSTIMNWVKYFNESSKYGWTGTALGRVPLNDLYMRYCVMLEKDVWTGMNEIGVKLGGMGGANDTAGGPFWHSKPDAQGRIRLTTYWYGEGINTERWTGDLGWAADLIQGVYLLPDTWHCLEQHLKLNSMNPDGTPNADAELEAWLDDKLIFSKKNFVIHRYTGYPLEIKLFHGQIFHGGKSTPLTPIHYRVTGFALAKRRIGAPQRMN